MKIRDCQLPESANQKSKQVLLARIVRLFAIVVVMQVFAKQALAGADTRIALTIVVNNYSQASPTTLTRAEREAGRILGQAGLQVAWVNCPEKRSGVELNERCDGEPAVDSLALRVLSRSSSSELNKSQDSVFGFAVHPILASVYYEAAAGLAHGDNAEFEFSVILGCVIVHELGHLLLGPKNHSGIGIMQAQWGRNQLRQAMMGGMLFTPEQSKRIREEVHRRTS